jgi:hypothetical protein
LSLSEFIVASRLNISITPSLWLITDYKTFVIITTVSHVRSATNAIADSAKSDLHQAIVSVTTAKYDLQPIILPSKSDLPQAFIIGPICNQGHCRLYSSSQIDRIVATETTAIDTVSAISYHII